MYELSWGASFYVGSLKSVTAVDAACCKLKTSGN